MKILKDYFKKINWWIIIYFIFITNFIFFITNNWSTNVLFYSTFLGISILIFSFIQNKYIKNPKINNIGVICTSVQDFIEWRNKYELNLFENKDYLPTTKKFKVDNSIFWRISNPNDCCGLILHDVVETDLAQTNPDYEKIKYIIQLNIISNKNIYIKNI